MKELKGLMRFVKPYRWWVVLATFCMIFVTVMSMAGPWAIRRLIATIEEGVLGTQDGLRRVGMLALTVVIIYILRAVSRFGTNYVSHYSAWNILDDIRSTMYNHIQKLSMKYFNDKQTGELMSRVINDTNNFEQLLAHAIPTIIVNGFKLPALATRKASTNVQFNDGSTLIIGGLLKREDAVNVYKVPLLGDIPIIGALFRSKNFQNGDTELLLFVTPKIIKSEADLNPDQITNPTFQGPYFPIPKE